MILRSTVYAAVCALACAVPSLPAHAQVAIDAIGARLFLERSGTLSDNIAGTDQRFVDVPKGGGPGGEPAELVFVTLTFTGPKDSRSSDRIARDLAAVTVTQAARTGPRVLLKRAYGGFRFGPDGRAHRAFVLDAATCAPLEIEVRVGRSRKQAKLDFTCEE